MFSFKQAAAILAIAFSFGCLVTTQAAAQTPVCVVDVAQVFENHSGFKAQLENLKQQAEQYKLELQGRAQQLQAQSEELRNYKVGSPEYKQLETELATASANLEVERRNKTREFVEMEAKVHFETYLEVTQVIGNLCEQRGYRMALRFTSTQMDATDPASIMQTVNEYVIFHRPQVDITQDVIRTIAGQNQMSNRPAEAQNR
ncbi:MAG: OmpH family outer membrane protein [Pirellulaceae bacterium]